MKIIESFATHSIKPANTQARNAGSSFAQLIEAGWSASRITDSRALGFNEIGVLGIHQGCARHHFESAEVPNRMQDASSHVETPHPVRSAGQGFAAVDSSAIRVSFLTTGASKSCAAELAADSNDQFQLETMQMSSGIDDVAVHTRASSPLELTDSHLGARMNRTRGRHFRASGQAVRFQLQEEREGLITVLSNLIFELEKKDDLFALAETIGREYGVTIDHVVTRLRQAGSSKFSKEG